MTPVLAAILQLQGWISVGEDPYVVEILRDGDCMLIRARASADPQRRPDWLEVAVTAVAEESGADLAWHSPPMRVRPGEIQYMELVDDTSRCFSPEPGRPLPARLRRLCVSVLAVYVEEWTPVRLQPTEQDQQARLGEFTFTYRCRARPYDPPALLIATAIARPTAETNRKLQLLRAGANLIARDSDGDAVRLRDGRIGGAWTVFYTAETLYPSGVAEIEFSVPTRIDVRTAEFEARDVVWAKE